MAVYRNSANSVERLTNTTRKHHRMGILIFGMTLCAAAVAVSNLKTGLIGGSLITLVLLVVYMAPRHKAQQRMASIFRSSYLRLDDTGVAWYSSFGSITIPRSDIAQVCLGPDHILVKGKSRRDRLRISSDLENFEELRSSLERWSPVNALRSDARESTFLNFARVYAIWIAVALVVYVAMVGQRTWIVVPAAVTSASVLAWNFIWCCRRIQERKWRVLLPVAGVFAAAALLFHAFRMAFSH